MFVWTFRDLVGITILGIFGLLWLVVFICSQWERRKRIKQMEATKAKYNLSKQEAEKRNKIINKGLS